MAEWVWPDGREYPESGTPPNAMSYAEYQNLVAARTRAVLGGRALRPGADDGPGSPSTGSKELAPTSSGAPAPLEAEVPKADGWWFCDPPTVEEIRFRLDRATGRLVAAFLTCEHGRWTDLRSARAAHSIEADSVET